MGSSLVTPIPPFPPIPKTGESCVLGVCCYTMSGTQLNDFEDSLFNWCDTHNCCRDEPGSDPSSSACSDWYDTDGSQDAYYTICQDSCNGDTACAYISNDTDGGRGAIVKINQGACNGESACEDTGYYNHHSVTIGRLSCVGYEACYDIQYDDDAYGPIVIGQRSCQGDSTCDELGLYSLNTIIIGNDSCIGYDACEEFGYYVEDGLVKIGNNSCKGYEVCYYIGESQEEQDTIMGDNSCLGGEACYYLGYSAINNIRVGNKSCYGFEACYYFGYNVEGMVEVKDRVCRKGVESECSDCYPDSSYDGNVVGTLSFRCPNAWEHQ